MLEQRREREKLESLADCLKHLVEDEGEICAEHASTELNFTRDEHDLFGRLHHLFVFQPLAQREVMIARIQVILKACSDRCC